MRRALLSSCALVLLCAGRLGAQPAQPVAASAGLPDISLTATVHARELYFHEVGDVTVTFRGGADHENVWHTDRVNLPKPVQARVLYRDIGVILTITTTLPEMDQILDEALGPASRIAPPDGNSAPPAKP